jgi:hypothetical protein
MASKRKPPLKRYRAEVYICDWVTVHVTARTAREATAKAHGKVAKRAIGHRAIDKRITDPEQCG